MSSADCGRYRELYFKGWGRILLAVAVVERWPLDEISWSLWRGRHCREVAVSRGSTVYKNC